MKLTPFARAQLSWAVLLLALFAMLELARDQNLAVVYFLAIVVYLSRRYIPHLGVSHPYWIVEVTLALGAIYIFFRFIRGG